ncbi:MAG: L-seryl-tRNA(Sec) selenium transferase [Desulfobacteraceae bacterium]|nr:L-seryl-tRNA(Sec) selenium transferase [Desulfobacteraceae bacterium]
MSLSEDKKKRLKEIPGIDTLILKIKNDFSVKDVPESLISKKSKEFVENLRKDIVSGKYDSQKEIDTDETAVKIYKTILKAHEPNFKRVINATGVVVHTNLGRSLLAKEAAEFVLERATGFSNLELDLKTGKRGLRYSLVEDLVCEISGCESAMVVNNNAAAVLLCLDTFARGREVVVSRGELVEIGGSFRIPEVMEKSGAVLKEVGTTNRTHLKDYANAHDETRTAMFLKVHTSNFDIIGFTSKVSLEDLSKLSREKNVILMEDLGSGTFIDFSRFGLPKEPTVTESVKAGTDLVTFSGDKLLGGPQAGIIAGKKELIEKIRKNPLTRALRIDKMTLAALEITLRLYRDPENAIKKIPTLKMISADLREIEQKAYLLKDQIDALEIKNLKTQLLKSSSRAGGGSLPETNIPTICLGIETNKFSASYLEKFMRKNNPPVMGRIENDRYLLDLRTVSDEEIKIIAGAFKNLKTELE